MFHWAGSLPQSRHCRPLGYCRGYLLALSTSVSSRRSRLYKTLVRFWLSTHHAIRPKSGGFRRYEIGTKKKKSVSSSNIQKVRFCPDCYPGKIPLENKENSGKKKRAHITQMNIASRPSSSRPALIRRTARPSRKRILPARPTPQHRAPGASKRLRSSLQVLIARRVGREDLVQEGQEAPVLAKRARRGRDFCRRSDGEIGRGRIHFQVGQDKGR